MIFDRLNNYLYAHNNSIRNAYFIIITSEIIIYSFFIFYFILIQEVSKEELNIVWNSAFAVGSILLFAITYEYVRLTNTLVEETKKTREAQEKPSISFRIIPDEIYPNLLNYSIKNSGAGGAFDIQISFDPDPELNSGTTLGKIPRSISYLGPKEEIRFLFADAPDYFNNHVSVKEFTVTIKYSKYPISEKARCGEKYYEKPVEYPINVEELRGAPFAGRKSVHDIAKELIELKQGVFLIGQELLDLEEQHLKSRKRI